MFRAFVLKNDVDFATHLTTLAKGTEGKQGCVNGVSISLHAPKLFTP
jgi:hypothetical protein